MDKNNEKEYAIQVKDLGLVIKKDEILKDINERKKSES